MKVKIAKEAAEGEVLLLGQVLVAKEDHGVFGQRAMDLVERPVTERLRQVDPIDLGADNRRQLVDRDRVVRARILSNIFDAGTIAAA
jgi:hypothetical protein